MSPFAPPVIYAWQNGQRPLQCGHHSMSIWQECSSSSKKQQQRQCVDLVNELSIDAPNGIAPVPVELLWARRLLPHTLQIVCTCEAAHTQALQVVSILQTSHALQTGIGDGQAGLLVQVGFGRASDQQIAARAFADKTVQVGAACGA